MKIVPSDKIRNRHPTNTALRDFVEDGATERKLMKRK